MKLRKLFPLFLLLLITGAVAASAQDATSAATPKASGDTLWKVIVDGGPPIIAIWCAILATSVTMVTFIFQNIISLRRSKLAPPAMVDSLRNEIYAGNYQEAWEICNANSNYLANVLKAGLSRIGRGKEATEDGIAEHALREAQILRIRNSYLSVIGVVSPMIGLLGTVIGMMGAFSRLSLADPHGLAASIGEVLTATASGLIIAIPAFIAYYFFRNRAQMVIVHADDQISSLISDIPYEELQGVQIGESFSAGEDSLIPGARKSRRVSVALSTNCPACNGIVSAGVNPCPHCGATLDWAQ